MTTRRSLLETLRRAHLRLGLAALAISALTLTLISLLTLRSEVERRLDLVARSIAYTAEAATVFGDAGAAQETLAQMANSERLRGARIVDAQGRVLASYTYTPHRDAALESVLAEAAALLFAQRAEAEILHLDRRYGTVQVQGRGVDSLVFLLKLMAAIALCSVANAWLVARLARRVDSEIVGPLNRLAALTRTAREQRALAMRAPDAAVKEIHELGEDFNALLAEIESREARLVARQEKLRSANESLSYLAFHDNLTGLPNRANFIERARQLAQTLPVRGESAALLFLDCDRFKDVNDVLGHAAGDELLVQVARRIRAELRDGDFVARLGGDEFAVLAPVATGEEARRLAQQIAEAIRRPIDTDAFGRIEASASIGVALLDEASGNLEQWLAAADAAMYRAKARSRGSVERFENRIDSPVRPRIAETETP